MTGTNLTREGFLHTLNAIFLDLYGKAVEQFGSADYDAVRAMYRMAQKYEIPFDIIVAYPIRLMWQRGEHLEKPPSAAEILDVIFQEHRQLLLLRDQSKHGRVSIIENLIPIRAMRRQLDNDMKVMETVAFHCGPNASVDEISRRGIHFVSEYWRQAERDLLECPDDSVGVTESAVRSSAKARVDRFYAKYR